MRDAIVNCVDPSPERGQVAVNVRTRCTLEIFCKFKKFEESYVEAIKGSILKPTSVSRLCNAKGVDHCTCHGLGPSKERIEPGK